MSALHSPKRTVIGERQFRALFPSLVKRILRECVERTWYYPILNAIVVRLFSAVASLLLGY